MFLPSPTGPYRVGLTTLVHAVEPTRKFGVARLKDGSHLLEMDAVVFNVFYPADVPAKDSPQGTQWVDQPLSASVTGVAKFTGISPWAIWPVSWLYSSRLKIPVFEDALPLKAKDGRWRLAIFSHGLAGSKTMYSQFCTNLASQGYVVLAMEHRDRSGMLFMTRDGQPRYYAGQDDIDWGESKAKQFALYVEQLEFRRSEIYTTYSVFSDIVQGSAHSVHKLDGGAIDAAPWKDLAYVNERVVLAGHSFGGCTALSILSSPPPEGHADIPFSHTLALDPWFEPLAIPGPMPPSYRESIPLCILNSQGFTLWKAHFPVVEQLVEKWPARSALFTLINCKHETFSDAYCLVPFSGRKFGKIFAAILSLSHAFVEDRLDDETKQQSVVPMIVEEQVHKGKTVRMLKGEPGQILVHKQWLGRSA